MTNINKYLKNLNRVEFLITYDCTGKCRHCSVGECEQSGICLDADIAASALSDIAEKYKITSVMTFGGESLLYPESVIAIHSKATELGIEKRQVITNGFFSKDEERIKSVAEALSKCGVNDILLSVDAFHQETIPLESVKYFAEMLVGFGASVRTNPAWLVSREDRNEYNVRTEKILREFDALGISEGSGNIIFPQGNAIKYLGDYFKAGKNL